MNLNKEFYTVIKLCKNDSASRQTTGRENMICAAYFIWKICNMVLTHMQQLYRTLRQSLTRSSFTVVTEAQILIWLFQDYRKKKLRTKTQKCGQMLWQSYLLLGFFFCIVSVGLIRISTRSFMNTDKWENHFISPVSQEELSYTWEFILQK